MDQKKFFFVTVISFVLMLSLVSCSASAPATMAPTTAPTTMATTMATSDTSVQINISGFAFDPSSLTVKEGTTVTWTNNDPTVHTVTSDTGVFDSGDMAQGTTYSYTFTTAGTYVYHCTPHHARMSGTIVVTK